MYAVVFSLEKAREWWMAFAWDGKNWECVQRPMWMRGGSNIGLIDSIECQCIVIIIFVFLCVAILLPCRPCSLLQVYYTFSMIWKYTTGHINCCVYDMRCAAKLSKTEVNKLSFAKPLSYIMRLCFFHFCTAFYFIEYYTFNRSLACTRTHTHTRQFSVWLINIRDSITIITCDKHLWSSYTRLIELRDCI